MSAKTTISFSDPEEESEEEEDLQEAIVDVHAFDAHIPGLGWIAVRQRENRVFPLDDGGGNISFPTPPRTATLHSRSFSPETRVVRPGQGLLLAHIADSDVWTRAIVVSVEENDRILCQTADRRLQQVSPGQIRPTLASHLLRARFGLNLNEMRGDGNCLFRAVSAQIYGTAAHHGLVRASCCDYMALERASFEPFVLPTDFGEYVAQMRQDGTWADDVQIQACSEIYQRPVEIFSLTMGGEVVMLKRFQDLSEQQPIRLFFHSGGAHYDSVSASGDAPHREQPGRVECKALEMARIRRGGLAQTVLQSDALETEEVQIEESAVSDALAMSVTELGQQDLDRVLAETLVELDDDDFLQLALEQSLRM